MINVLKSFLIILKAFFSFLKWPFFAFLGFVCLFFVLVSFYILKGLYEGLKLPDRHLFKYKRHGFFRQLFIDLPKQYADDIFNTEPDFFPYQGCIIFTGRQGAGKTISAVEYALFMHKRCPDSKMITNLNVKGQDSVLNDWRPLMSYKNGKAGVIAVLDETQNWFSSNQSASFPPEMLSVITQNRKNRRIILGTAQSFNRLAKPIREQATEVRQCYTFLGCLTVVIRREPILTCDGDVESMKYRGMYMFVHTKELRESYDTYHVIESLRKSGFKPPAPMTNTNVFVTNQIKKK